MTRENVRNVMAKITNVYGIAQKDQAAKINISSPSRTVLAVAGVSCSQSVGAGNLGKSANPMWSERDTRHSSLVLSAQRSSPQFEFTSNRKGFTP
jgi:hypothetical protein